MRGYHSLPVIYVFIFKVAEREREWIGENTVGRRVGDGIWQEAEIEQISKKGKLGRLWRGDRKGMIQLRV